VAQNLADEIYTRILNGEDFGELAKIYSHGHRSIFGGQWQPVNPDNLAEPYDTLANHSKSMQSGQIAEPIQTNEHIFIMKLEEKSEYYVEPFQKVQQQIESTIRITQQRQALDQLSREIASEVAIPNKERFLNFCLQKLYVKASQ
jgi:parvulin-like peptidyl-prolyl isomerase